MIGCDGGVGFIIRNNTYLPRLLTDQPVTLLKHFHNKCHSFKMIKMHAPLPCFIISCSSLVIYYLSLPLSLFVVSLMFIWIKIVWTKETFLTC